MKWVNILGLVFQFVAFWFAAPELLGANTLKRFETGLKRTLATLPMLVVMLVVLGYGITFSYLGITKGLNASETGMQKDEMISFFVVMGICTVLYFVFIIFYKRIKTWLETRLAQPLITSLIENNQARSLALGIGAALFTLGFLLQLSAAVLA